MRTRFELTILAAAGVEKCQLKCKLGFGHVKRETRNVKGKLGTPHLLVCLIPWRRWLAETFQCEGCSSLPFHTFSMQSWNFLSHQMAQL